MKNELSTQLKETCLNQLAIDLQALKGQLKQPSVHVASLYHRQERLALSVYLFNEQSLLCIEKAKNMSEAFVQVAGRILLKHPLIDWQDRLLALYKNEAWRWAIELALILFSGADAAKSLSSLFYSEPELRSGLLKLWLELNVLPERMLLESLNQEEDQALLEQALFCALWQERYGIDVFRRHYRSLLVSKSLNVSIPVLLMSLLGAILRGETQLRDLLSFVLQQDIADEYHELLMACLALSGDPLFDKTLDFYSKNYPASGQFCLAIRDSLREGATTALFTELAGGQRFFLFQILQSLKNKTLFYQNKNFYRYLSYVDIKK